MTVAELQILVTEKGADAAARSMSKIGDDVNRAGKSADSAGGSFGKMVSGLGQIGMAGMGISTVTTAATGLGNALGLGLANQMEQTRASMMAFYKDSGKVEEVLAMVKKEAASTPFAFADIATAASQLGPVAKTANVDLLSIIRTAEALSASNPMQGFEGAVFALKEAVSGDMASIVDRFNLSRSAIKQYRESGMTDLQAVQKAMADQGITYDLVAAQAQTMTGRWSTFKDTFDEVRMAVATPIFEALKTALMQMQPALEGMLPGLKTLGEQLGAGLAAAISGTMAKIGEFAGFIKANWGTISETLTTGANAFQRIADVAGTVVTALAPLGRNILGNFAEMIQTVAGSEPALAALAVIISGTLVPAIAAWTAATIKQTVAQAAAGIAFMAANAPLILIVGTIALLVAGIVLLVKHWDTIVEKFPILGTIANEVEVSLRNFGSFVTDTVVPAVKKLWDILQTPIDVGSIVAPFSEIGEKAMAAFDWIVDFDLGQKIRDANWGAKMLDAVSEIFTSVKDKAGEFISELWDKITSGWNAGVDELKASFSNLQDSLSAAWDAIKETASAAWDGLKSLVAEAWEGIVSRVTEKAEALQTALSEAWDAIKEAVSAAWDTVKTKISDVWDSIKTLVSEAASAIQTKLEETWESIKTRTTDAWEAVKTIVTTVWDVLKETVSTALSTIQERVSAAWDAIKTATSAAWDAIKSAVSAAWDAIKEAVSSAISAVREAVSSGMERVQSTMQSAWDSLRRAAESAWNTIKSVVSAGVDAVVSKMREIASAIPGVSSALSGIERIAQSVAGAFQALGRGIETAASAASRAVGPLQSAASALNRVASSIPGVSSLIGRSPSPLAVGIQTAADAARTAPASFDRLSRSLDRMALPGALAAPSAAPVASGASIAAAGRASAAPVTVQVTVQGNVIGNQAFIDSLVNQVVGRVGNRLAGTI